MKPAEAYLLGADFGSDSVRVVAVDAFDGSVAGSHVCPYPRWSSGAYCDPKQNRFRQHPLDYIESFTTAVQAALGDKPQVAAKVRAISVDTTGSTPCLCDSDGIPLSLHEDFASDPDAMFVLWKDHTAIAEADEINALCSSWGGTDYRIYSGGTYSSEWYWSKLLHVVRSSPHLTAHAAGFVEHCDWFPALLTATESFGTIKRSRCAAGHKVMWHTAWGGYPSAEFLNKLHPFLSTVRASLGNDTFTADVPAGLLSVQWARQLGLVPGIPVCVGAYDAHIGAVGGGVAEAVMVKSVGTSTCDIIIGRLPHPGEPEPVVEGIVGQVDGSVVPGFMGYEGGQSAYGDYYAWLRDALAWPLKNLGILSGAQLEQAVKKILPTLEREAQSIEPTEESPVALDWINGRRSPKADQRLRGALTGLSLGSDAPVLMRMLLESTAFGARAILECFVRSGVRIDKIVAVGGVARKSIIGMQILADVTGRDIHVTDNDLAPAIGAAVFASVAAGLYPDVQTAQRALCSGTERVHRPDARRKAVYDVLYAKYLQVGAFEEKMRRG